MLQLKVLSGKQAGYYHPLPHFPCIIGRSGNANVRFEDNGVWDQHCEISLDSSDRFVLAPLGNALVSVNGSRIDRAFLRNGDQLEIGGVKAQIWLREVPQKSLQTRELLTWIGLALFCLSQIALIRALSH